MTAQEIEYRAWYQPYTDARGGRCSARGCTETAVGRTVYSDGERTVERRQCALHLPSGGGGVQ